MSRALAFAALAVAACTGASTDDAPRCEVSAVTRAATAADRKLIGAGGAYDADATLRERDAELRGSMAARREAAWATVAKVVAPVPLAHAVPNVPDASVPLWQTWYGKDDVHRMFVELYSAIDPAERPAHPRLSDADIDAAFGWNAVALDDLPTWNDARWAAYLAEFETVEDVASVGGVARVRYSPSAARHVMQSYAEILDCMAAGVPPEVADGPEPPRQQVVRQPVALAACASGQVVGPLFAAADSILSARFEGQGDAVVEVRDEAGDVVCAAAACDVAGPGRFSVSVVAGATGATGALAVDYAAPNPAWSACLAGAFPVDTVVIKAAWRRADLSSALATYDTSAAGLTARHAAADPDWEVPDGTADPGPADIYTIRTGDGAAFRLVGLHVMTKELDHWQWITLWWSPEPDTDFGADRPEDVTGVWRNYKMCAATAFAEGDPDPTGGYGGSLGDALAAVHSGAAAPTWCSNPYLETGAGNAATNCIGCHQHGGTGLASEAILGERPAHGNTELRNNFPTDYTWAIDRGDRLGTALADIVQFYDSAAK